MDDPPPDRARAIETASFLTRSEYRADVLEALAEAPLSRSELQEVTGTPRVTLGRILAALEQRGWIDRDGQRYRTTPTGIVLAEALTSFLDTIGTVQKLDGVADWLPSDALPFDLTCLADAEIVLPKEGDPMAPVRRAAEWLVDADRIRVASPVVLPESLEANWMAVTQRRQTFEGVFPSSVIDAIAADSEMAAWAREMLTLDRASFYRYDGDIPHAISTTENVAALPLSDDQGLPRALIVTDDEEVHRWVEAKIDAYRRAADRIDPTQFSP